MPPPRPPRFHTEHIDLLTLQRRGTESERQRMAERMFAVWQPLFAHLADKDPSFHRARHVEDTSASYLRASFFRVGGVDRGLMIARLHEHRDRGLRFARMTFNAGVHQELRGTNAVGPTVVRTILHGIAAAPRRPLFLVDVVASLAAWRALHKPFPWLLPSPAGAIPDAWWPVALAGAEALHCTPIEGRPRGIVRSQIVMAEGAGDIARAASPEAARLDAWYRSFVRPGESLLVVAPVTAWGGVSSIGAWLARVARHALGGRSP